MIKTEFLQTIKGYNSNIRLLFIVNILTQIGLGVFMVVYNFYIRELGFAETVNGKVIAMSSLAAALVLIPAGILSDKIGRRKMMIVGLGVSGLFMVLRSVFATESLLLSSAFVAGIAMAFIQVTGVPWLAENSTKEQRVKLFSYHFAVMMGANVIGNLIGGTMTDFLLHAVGITEVWSIRITLLIGSIIFSLGIFPLLKTTETYQTNKKTEFSFRQLKASFPQGQLRIILIFAFSSILIGFGSGLVIPYLNLYFADRFQTSNSTIGIVLSLGQAVTAVAMIIGPAVVRRVGEMRAVVILQVLSLPFMLITAFTQVFWLAALGFLFRQALMNAANPIISSMMMDKVDNSLKGFANSMNQMVFSLGWASMGPVSMGIVLVYGEYWGYSIVFSITAVLYLTSSIFFYLMFREKSTVSIAKAVVKTS
ncbi:major facilitator superfamily transporter [Bacillus sp. THAF10]|uniref:MFS transporter n=1 Tax=Bacillus sp. THAF10 TaxID=2587848 RepID=UPI001268BFBD|nr:MFS transporter [Bacillus sp. THAF10]QFT90490.1 major facilitator superfamily transporter [Bacillus sp. THAF10]